MFLHYAYKLRCQSKPTMYRIVFSPFATMMRYFLSHFLVQTFLKSFEFICFALNFWPFVQMVSRQCPFYKTFQIERLGEKKYVKTIFYSFKWLNLIFIRITGTGRLFTWNILSWKFILNQLFDWLATSSHFNSIKVSDFSLSINFC